MFEGTGIKILSLIIGILFIFGLVFMANRFGKQLRGRLQSRIANTQITPSPVIPTQTPEVVSATEVNPDNFNGLVSTPAAGAEMLIYPILLASLGLGMKLRKTGI